MPPAPTHRPLHTAALVALSVVLVVILAYARPLFGGDTFALRDHVLLTLPSRAMLADALAHGRIPEWWPGVGLGIDVAGNPMHGVTYPPAWLVAVLPMPLGADLVALLHLVLFGCGIGALSRRLGASPAASATVAASGSVCGYAGSMLVMGVPLMTLAWTPSVLVAVDRLARAETATPRARAALILAAVWAVQLMSGDPAGAITSVLLAGLWMLVRAERRGPAVLAMLAAGTGAVVLAAVTLAPALAVLSESTRAGGTANATAWSMHPLRVLEWFWPHALGDSTEGATNLAAAVANTAAEAQMGSGWALSLFLGVPLSFACAAAATREHRRRSLLAVSAVFVVLALGRFTPLYGAYRAVFWPERLVRYPERHLIGAIVVWLALAGPGIDAWVRGVSGRMRGTLVVVAAMLSALAVIAFALTRAAEAALPAGLDAARTWSAMRGGLVTTALATAAVAVAAVAVHRRSALARLARPLWAGAIAVPLVLHTWALHPLVPRAALTRPPALLEPLIDGAAGGAAHPRVYRNRQLLPRTPATIGDARGGPGAVTAALHDAGIANTGTRFGVDYVPGYDPSISARMRELWARGARRGMTVLTLLSVDHLIAPAGAAIPGAHELARFGGLALFEVGPVRPRAFTTASWRPFTTTAALFDPSRSTATIDVEGIASRGLDGAPPRPCTVVQRRPENVVLTCDATRDGFAVLADAWAPGWSSTVDGRPAPLYRADAVLRAVPITAGRHRVELRFRAPGLRAGAAASAAGWLLVIALALWLRRESRRSATLGDA